MDSNRSKNYYEDEPIHSRLFIVYDKNLSKTDLEQAFSKFGVIEDIKVPLDQNGVPKVVCFIKFSKTSEAAYALEAMDGKVLPNALRPLKVMVAANRSEIERSCDEPERYKRLFLHVPRDMSEIKLENIFSEYGQLRAVTIQKDHHTRESKGFAYVTYAKFSEAARAYEECERQYRPIFAKPKLQRRPMTSFESNIGALAGPSGSKTSISLISKMASQCRNEHGVFTRVLYMCCPQVSQYQMGRLFDLVPGMDDFQFYVDLARNCGKGIVTYNNPTSATYAVEKLNEFEYPPGMMIYVKPEYSNFDGQQLGFRSIPKTMRKLKNAIQGSTKSGAPDLAELAEAIAEASKLIKMATGDAMDETTPNSNDINYCSVNLPPPMPLAHIDSDVAKRLFLVCKPAPPSLTVLRDVFCRFGELINVYTLPNKTVGYARYASASSANEAMNLLHGAEICGVRMKVIEAEEEAPPKKRKL